MIRLKHAATLAALVLACAAASQVERPINLGETLPPLDLEYVKGSAIAEPNGEKITLVEFWATWCAPCLRTIPHLTELQHRYGDDGLQIVGISDETRETVQPFVDQMGEKMEYAVAVDMQNKTSNRFREPGGPIPRAYLFNESGRLIWIGHPADHNLERLIKELTEELSGGH